MTATEEASRFEHREVVLLLLLSQNTSAGGTATAKPAQNLICADRRSIL